MDCVGYGVSRVGVKDCQRCLGGGGVTCPTVRAHTYTHRYHTQTHVFLLPIYRGGGGFARGQVRRGQIRRGGNFATSRNREASNTLLLLNRLRMIPGIS